jgi:hypothetical protein
MARCLDYSIVGRAVSEPDLANNIPFLTDIPRANKLPVSPVSGEDSRKLGTMHPLEIARAGASCVRRLRIILALLLLTLTVTAAAQTCLAGEDLEPATKTSLETTARKYFDLVAKGDVASLRQNAIPSVAADFSGIEAAVRDNQSNFAGAQATVRPPYLLQAEGKEPLPRAEFLCGVFGKSGQTSNSAVFVIPNLPAGDYAVAILDVAAKSPATLAFVLQKSGNDWKFAGFYARSTQIAGHDGQWFANQAREFKNKNQNHNAWFYYQESRELLVPVPFMSTMVTDKIYDEMQSVQPTDLPAGGNSTDFVADGKTYKLTAAFLVGVGNDLDLVVKYASPDISNSNQTYQQNVALIKALAVKFPELRNGFAAIVARAVEPSGRDYGTMTALKDVK